jgi:hypothetical protein
MAHKTKESGKKRKHLANLTKIRKEKTQIIKIKNKKREITTKAKEMQGNIQDYFENLYSNRLENHEEMDKYLHTYDHPKLNQEDINFLNRSIICNEIEIAIKSFPKKKSPGPHRFSLNSNIPLKKN